MSIDKLFISGKTQIFVFSLQDPLNPTRNPNFQLEYANPITVMDSADDCVIFGDSSGLIHYWNYEGTELSTIKRGHSDAITTMSTFRNRYLLSGSKDCKAILWDLTNESIIKIYKHTHPVTSVAFNSSILLTGDEYSDLYVWDFEESLASKSEPANSKDLLLRTLTGHSGTVIHTYLTPTTLVSCDNTGLAIQRDFFTCITSSPALRIIKTPDGVNCMTCDSKWIVTGLLDKTIAIYERKSMEKKWTLKGHTDQIWSLDMNDKFLVSGSWDSTVKIWSKLDNYKLISNFNHPHDREISGVLILNSNLVFVSCLSGALCSLKFNRHDGFVMDKLVSEQNGLGEIYSLATDGTRLLPGHTKTSTSLQLWSLELDVLITIRENTSESIIWSLHLHYPLALVCRDNETLDIYHIESQTCLKSLKHESKVLNATLHQGIIIVGCQYGILTFWNLEDVLKSSPPNKILDSNVDSLKMLREHSGAIANVYVDSEELITDDYDGIVMLRKWNNHSYF